MDKFIVSVTHNEFDLLKKAFPNNAHTLDQIATRTDRKTKINLQDISPEKRQLLDTETIDHLYQMANHLREDRFSSYYLQLREILSLPRSKSTHMLEIGPGAGIFESLVRNFEYHLITLDINQNNEPDIKGNMLNLPLQNNAVDITCIFEVFEHLPYENFQPALQEISRVSKNFVFLSLPCPTNSIHWNVKLAFLQRFWRRFSFQFRLFRPLPTSLPDKDEAALMQRDDIHNPHFWEVNRRSFPKRRILSDIASANLTPVKSYHNPYYPYHFFVLCQVAK